MPLHAAWYQARSKAGIAWIISEPSGTIIRQGSATQESVNSPIVAEALALRLGIIAAVNLGLPKIKMTTQRSSEQLTTICRANKFLELSKISNKSHLYSSISLSRIFLGFKMLKSTL
ncbi:hypothetical protein F2Q68_00000046 [Brassica cretica]|uniref:RNase H type-1 domain-containing protein n=1 Tax=Brassica cretica TaxID=69181 RepID=A0A8S9JHP7_BRACR|nr:hypothetical protein F2Q68_00000046 [Brassica cretica]